MKKLTSRAASTRGVVATRQMPSRPSVAGARHQHGERDQHDQRQVAHGEAQRQAEAGHRARLADPWQPAAEGGVAHRTHRFARRPVNLVELAAIGEMLGLRLGPAAEDLVDGHQLDLGEARQVGGIGRIGLGRAVEVAGDDLLRRRRVEEIEIGLRHLARAALVDDGIDQGDRRLGQDRERRHHDLELVGAELLQDQEGLVLPRDQRRRRPRAGRRSWSSRARPNRAPARCDRSPRRTCAPPPGRRFCVRSSS